MVAINFIPLNTPSLPLVLTPLFTMSFDHVVRLGPKLTLRLKTSSPKPANSDSSYQSSVSACPPGTVEASRSQKKRSRDARYETDTPAVPSSAIPPSMRAIVPLRRKITIATNGKSVVGHSQNNAVMACSYGGDSHASEHLSQDWEMSALVDPPGAHGPTQLLQPQDDCKMEY
ncbi:hypothetical protein DFJ58DRAFT_10919 [Suillus subalutaceus]|uniref:uncharacterized protein n=1 Tax=Suillus subalutaceus TaxID=48586 RepID=UPI001B868743|nr:uncharacterized protein DFJ58DRAFT_10919 [Suillus subalutaceus]KAG1877909.1 hypothetical protein DFJ58DRAFT_10919 [Suillus subalutaceus]